MLENFQAEPLFEGRTYECFQFTLTINGEEYKGVFKEDEKEINWYQPKPIIENENRTDLEIQVYGLMNRYLQ